MGVNHSVFSRLYIWGQEYLERAVGNVRIRQNERAYGRALIVGAGSGLDVAALGAHVTEIVLLQGPRIFLPVLRPRLASRRNHGCLPP